ncbi:MAG: sigma-70 family RNA polymerase sigma factor [Planctomycetes bacterium]|nr:sigma-70 family RNA polymerase sigma factor [Planctomycetota bacterium]
MDRPAAPLDPDLLHRHAPGLRALVRTLVLDDSRVDDIVQETWLAALKRPPQQTEKAGAWLAVVARRIVQRGKRERARRAQREERAAKPEGLPSAQEIVAREMARRELVDVVLELDEPYRTTVLLRYFEDLGPQEIAERLEAPLETVRTRLKRGLERLREKLDRKNGGNTRAWHLALLPLANLPLGPFAPLPAPSGGEGALAGAGSSSPAWLGAGAIAAGAAVLGAAALGWALLRGGADSGDSAGEAVALAPLASDGASNAAHASVARETSANDAATLLPFALRERATAAPLAAIEVGASSGPWAAFETLGWVRRSFEREEENPAPALSRSLGASDANGRLSVPRDEAERFPFVLDPHWSPVLPPESFGAARELVLEPAGVLRGRVRAVGAAAQRAIGSGTAIARLVPLGTRDGRLHLGFWDALRGARGVAVARDGGFRFDSLPLALAYRLEVYAPGAGLAVRERIELSAPGAMPVSGDAELELTWDAAGARVEGFVGGAEGFPIEGARLALHHLGSSRDGVAAERGRGDAPFGPLELDAIARQRADDSGTFAFENLPDGRYRLEVRADGCEPAQRIFDIEAGAAEPLALRLELGAALEGVVRDAAGAPVEGALAFALTRAGDAPVRTDAEGRFRFRELGAGAIEVLARGAGGIAMQRLELLRGEVGWVELALAPRAPREAERGGVAREPARETVDLRARLVERGSSRRIVGALVEVDHGRGRGAGRGDGGPVFGSRPRAALSDAEGELLLAGLRVGRAQVRVQREGYGEVSFELELAPGGEVQVLELAPAAQLAGVLRDRSGAPLAARMVLARGNGARVAATDAEGRFAFVDLAPGTWSLGVPGPNSVAALERGIAALLQLELAPGADERCTLEVDPLPEGRVELVLQSQLATAAALELRGVGAPLDEIERRGRVATGEAARFAALPPGRYRLMARTEDGVLHLRELELEGALVEIALATDAARPLVAQGPAGVALELLHAGFAETRPSGERRERGGRGPGASKGRRSEAPRAVVVGSGSWTLELVARDESGQLYRGQVSVSSGEASPALAGSTLTAELAPWTPEVPPSAPAAGERREKARR